MKAKRGARSAVAMKPPAAKARRQGRLERLLKQFQATDPATLDAEARRYRDLAIRALQIELKLRSDGWTVGQDGWAVPGAAPPQKAQPRPPRRPGRAGTGARRRRR
jgi:hypothetical protein